MKHRRSHAPSSTAFTNAHNPGSNPMSPKDDDNIRKLILERRARFLATALATTGLNACTVDTGPSVCLSLPVSIDTNTNTSTNTLAPVDTCRNPPACVCLGIALTYYPPTPVVAPSIDLSNGSSDATDGSPADAGSGDAGLGDAGSGDAGDAGSDSGPNSSTSTGQESSVDTSSTVTAPSVCLSLLATKKKK